MTHYVLHKEQRCYHCAKKTQVIESILKLNSIQESVISQILWIRLMHWMQGTLGKPH